MSGGCQPLLHGGWFQGEYLGIGGEHPADDALHYLSYFMDGFAYAAEALSGKYYGAKNMVAFREVVRRTMGFGLAVAAGFTLLYMIGGENFLAILTDDERVITAAGDYFWWAVLIPLAGMAAFVFDGIFVGITQSKSMLCSTAIASASFFALFSSCIR